jgi:hypothetical protein
MSKRKSKKRNPDDAGLSTTTVTASAGVVVAYLLWGVACAMYDTTQGAALAAVDEELMSESDAGGHIRIPVRGSAGVLAIAIAGVVTFVTKSFSYLPQLPGVVSFVVRERFWFVIVSFAVLGGVVLFGWFLKRTEESLKSGRHFRRR